MFFWFDFYFWILDFGTGTKFGFSTKVVDASS